MFSRTEEAVKTWEVAPEELREWEGFFSKRAIEAFKVKRSRMIAPSAFHPDETACRFCRAKARCPALARVVLLATNQFSETLSNDELSKALDTLPLVESYVKAIKDEAHKVLNAGEELPNYELKEGRKGNRTYKDEQQAEQVLRRLFGDQATKSVLLSPNSIERLAKTKDLTPEELEEVQELIIRPNGKPVITRNQEEDQQQASLSEFKAVA